MSGPPSSQVPTWLTGLEARLLADLPSWFTQFAPPDSPPRESAVLMLFGPDPAGGEDVVLTERSAHLRSHASQVSFPGGRLDPGEDHVEAALREAQEEIGLDPAGVEVIATLPPLYLHPSQNSVTPVLGWWHDPHAVDVVDPGEVAHVARVPVAELADPRNRFTVTAPGGYEGVGFDVAGLYVWGFTAGLLDVLLEAGQQAVPWDTGRRRRLPVSQLKPYLAARARRFAPRRPGGR